MRISRTLFFSTFLAFILLGATYGQQVADPNFDAKVARPAYTKNHPKVLFDEAHNNFHTSTGRYKPFADLITNDGYIITPNKEKFQKNTLSPYQVLVVANALGAERQNMPEASRPAFTEEECAAVRDWVRAGGSLLLIADHAPFGAAADNLARIFGVEMSKGHTSDPANHDSEIGNMSFLVFTRANNLIREHPITAGRDASERINRVMTFTGQSLKGPSGSVALLQLADTAMDITRPAEGEAAASRPVERLPDGTPLPPGARIRSTQGGRTGTTAAGRAQAVAFDFGQGRVVVLGEAAMLSAQLLRGPAAQFLGRDELQMGMNRKGIDNRQLALNIMHWLSRR
jgi:hypothetical protein